LAERIAVFGAGSWGTALAILLARNGREVMLWGRDPERMAAMRSEGCNPRYLPDASFPPGLNPTADLDQALAGAELALVAVPSEAFRQFLRGLAERIRPGLPVVWATKGLEAASGKLLHQVAGEELGDRPTAVISGPTFAREVAAGLPTAITAASPSETLASRLAVLLHGEAFRVYTSTDVIGVEAGGALKNVLAIAAGVADGQGFGANARAALITRGLVEIVRLGERLGGHRETFMGLAGLGDLVLTCTDDQSRNRRFGLALGRGQSVEQALADIGQVVEGMRTARIASVLAQRNGVEMPICEQVYRVVYEGIPAREAVHALLLREQKPEDVD
jgi:glycerol-3-phosphate dehydrogenase (NAD(P)+)